MRTTRTMKQVQGSFREIDEIAERIASAVREIEQILKWRRGEIDQLPAPRDRKESENER